MRRTKLIKQIDSVKLKKISGCYKTITNSLENHQIRNTLTDSNQSSAVVAVDKASSCIDIFCKIFFS